MIQKKIESITKAEMHPGFLGEGHMAAAVISGKEYSHTDPFILLMDDRLDLPGGNPVGGPHPHAGFETVTLVLQGDGKEWKTGSLEIMTAGKGIVHTEEIVSKTKMHILQLWLALPPEKRWITPSWQQIQLEDVPVYQTDKSRVLIYSGSSNGKVSPIQNHTPLTLVDFAMEKGATIIQTIPSAYNGFIYVLEGAVSVGGTEVRSGETAWLDRHYDDGETEISFQTNDNSARFILYAGKPHNVPIISHGPFIGDTREDIVRRYHEYNKHQMPHLNDLDESRKIVHRATIQ